MPDLKNLENVYLVIAFIVPGLIITYARSQFITGRSRSHTENTIVYLALSVVYYGIALPGFEYVVAMVPSWRRTVAWFLLTFIGPAIFGLVLGVTVQRGWGRWLAHRLRLNPIHAFPTAWDWKFAGASKGARYVLVTVGDGTIAGVFGENSFASSDPVERDLYIEEVWDRSDTGEWTRRSERAGILIPGKEIKNVQFWEHQ
jgi:NhaP-type Na+/H+ or K+/H+ antiporter